LDPETSPDGFDGIIGQNELNDVLLNFGNSSDPAANTIPEPTSLALLGIGGLAIGRRRRA
ncbi:MAG: PEP-CTERM sorting domain-containing protein, partial [Planctomycetota bacterium]